MIQFQITNVDAVCDFLYEMYSRYGHKFDPAKDLRTLTVHNISLFSAEEATYLDAVMTDCFIFCVLNGININTLADMVECDIQQLSHAA